MHNYAFCIYNHMLNNIDMYVQNQYETAFEMIALAFTTFCFIAATVGCFYTYLMIKSKVYQWQWSVVGSTSLAGLVLFIWFIYQILYNNCIV